MSQSITVLKKAGTWDVVGGERTVASALPSVTADVEIFSVLGRIQ